MACGAVTRQRPLWRVVGWRGKGGNGEQTQDWILLGKVPWEPWLALQRNPANVLGRGGAGRLAQMCSTGGTRPLRGATPEELLGRWMVTGVSSAPFLLDKDEGSGRVVLCGC